jgi:hypothetical protein
VLDLRRADPVGDEVNNIDEITALLFNPTIKAHYFLFKRLKSLLDKKQSISIFIAQTNLKTLSNLGVSQI